MQGLTPYFAVVLRVPREVAETIAAELKGVGLSKARAIVEYREKHGPFKSPGDLSLVKGIGERTVDRNRSDIQVSTAEKK